MRYSFTVTIHRRRRQKKQLWRSICFSRMFTLARSATIRLCFWWARARCKFFSIPPSQDDPSCTWQIAESGQILTRSERQRLSTETCAECLLYLPKPPPRRRLVGSGVMGLICLLASLPWLLFPTRFFTRYNANRIFIIEQKHTRNAHFSILPRTKPHVSRYYYFPNTYSTLSLCAARTSASAVSINKRTFVYKISSASSTILNPSCWRL